MRLQNILFASLAHILPVLARNNTTAPCSYQTFRSVPAQEPPVIFINKTGETDPRLLFFPQSGSKAHIYSLNIYRENGELVWVSDYGDCAAFRRTELFGGPVLAYCKGISFSEPWGFECGVIYILNQ